MTDTATLTTTGDLPPVAKPAPEEEVPVLCVLELHGHGNIVPSAIAPLRDHCRDLFLACEAVGIILTGGFQPGGQVATPQTDERPRPNPALAAELGVAHGAATP